MRRSGLVATVGVLALLGTGVAAGTAAADSHETEVLASGFEDGDPGGWFGRGDATVAVSTEQARTGEASLLTSGRTASWQGPGYDLRETLQPGVSYEIETYVRLADADAADLHLSVQRTPAGGDTAFERVASDVPATGDGWARVAGSYSFDSEDNDELQLYLESPDETGSFYLDDVRITTTELPEDVLAATDFETGTAQGWGARGPEQVAATQDDAFAGDWSLLTSDREEPWNGPALTITEHVEPGATYGFSLRLKLAPGQDPAALRLSLQTDADGESSFDNLTPDLTVTPDEWLEATATWTPTDAADAFHVYVESADALVDFYLDDFVLSGVAPPEIEDIPPLHEVLGEHFPTGAAIDARETAGASAELLTKHFNSVTAENHMKPESIQPEEGTFTFAEADELVEFAEANDMRIYGHTLVWHSQTPDWFFQDENGDPLSGDDPAHRQLLLDRMQAHIEAVADHYGDRMWAWDVVNEAIDDSQDDGLRRSPWYEIVGPDYLAHAFQFARDAFGPDVQLYLNDYNTEFPAKREAMFEVVEGLLADGVPIDGVGHQLHLNLVRPISLVEGTLERFRELPVAQAVTELDVSISETTEESLPEPPPERVVRQGYYYRDLFEVLRAHDDVLASVTAWGLHDGRSWLRTWPVDRPHEAPLFFDDQLQSKPAYWGVVDPAELPHFPQGTTAAGGTPEVDGDRELAWDLLPGTVLAAGSASEFQLRWDTDNLYVLVEVADDTVDPADAVELYVDDSNAKNGEYQEGDAHYTVGRDGAASDGATAAVTETGSGYRVEAALPLLTAGEPGREVGFDLRVTDGATGERLSWSDQSQEQDTDTSRWGTVTLVEPVSHVDVPFTDAVPEIDGAIDPAWDGAPAVTTEVLVEGAADGAQAQVRLLWDEQRLYVLAEVTDPQLDAGNSNAWEQDSVEIFVDPGNTKSGPYQPGDGQYRISFENHQSLNGDLDVIGDNLTSETAVVDGGYVVEASVELSPMEPEAGSLLGLELQVNDATDGARTAAHTWHDPTGQSFQDTSRWGVARLVAADSPEPTCDRTVDGLHFGRLTVTGGTTCLADGALVVGPVTVEPGASLVASGAKVLGPLTASGAEVVQLDDSRVAGPVRLTGGTGQVAVTGNWLIGPVNLTGNQTGDTPIVIAGNTLVGPLSCTGNDPAPTAEGDPNTVIGPRHGQCRHL